MTTQTESQIKHHPDDWSFTSDHHHHVERTVQPVIVELSKWMTQTVPPNSSSTVLDDGCGVGSVTAELKKSFPELTIVAIDSSAGMLDALNRKGKKHGWKNVETKLLDGGDMTDIPSASITHGFACTYIDLAHNATACIRELHRVIAPGGIIGVTTWVDPIHPSISTPWTKACQEVYPAFKPPLVTSPKWNTREQIREHLEKAGFKDVQTKQVHAHWSWKDPEEMTEWFFNAGNPVCKRWHEALTEVVGTTEVGAKDVGRHLGDMKERFHEQLKREYRMEEGGHMTKEELVNVTIARK